MSTAETLKPPSPTLSVSRARQGLLLFGAALGPLSLFGYWFNLAFQTAPLMVPSLPLMLAPALASLVARLLLRQGFGDLSFRLRGPRLGAALVTALGLPLVVAAAAYGTAYWLGLARFTPPPFPVAVESPLLQFGLNLLFAGTLGLVLLLPTSAGEEIGWRGYFLPQLIGAGVPRPVLVSAILWGMWHLPMVFAGVCAAGPSLIVSALLLLMATAVFGSILGWLRLGTGSLAPPILLHAAWNGFLNGAFTPATTEAGSRLWTGETGVLVVLMLSVTAVWLQRVWAPAVRKSRLGAAVDSLDRPA